MRLCARLPPSFPDQAQLIATFVCVLMERRMRYRFHVHSAAFALMDVVGMELPDNDCAKAIAKLIIESFEDDEAETHITPWTRCVEIQDYKGTPLMAVPFKSLH